MTAPLGYEPVRVAVVGLGYWGPNLVRNLLEVDSAAVVAMCDRSHARLARASKRFPSVSACDDFDELLAREDVEAVAIATPVRSHAQLGMRALEAGKHVFIEKPMAASSAEASALAEEADSKGLTIMPGHTFLYSPPVNMIHDAIRGGRLGDIYYISMSRVNLGIHQSDVSVIWDLGPHDFSILEYWLQEVPSSVSAVSRACAVEGVADVMFIHMEYASGIVVNVEVSWLAPSKLRRTAVVGSRQMIVYDDTSVEPVRLFDSGVSGVEPGDFGEFRMAYRTGPITSPPVPAVEPLRSVMDDFCQSVRTGGKPRASSDGGISVIAVIEAAEASAALGGARVQVDKGGVLCLPPSK